ncbi:MAG TPA: toll/interleukin-1 receptor domain-containing protein, partial [Planctomycetota bacterium]|nr:toll/interleukin-1 receptor domain-containing protein [Planctomycetota bacterium]
MVEPSPRRSGFPRRTSSVFALSQWKRFLISWAILLIICYVLYESLAGPKAIFPDLGACHKARFGNAVLREAFEGDAVRIRFAPSPAGTTVAGGVFWQNWFTTLRDLFPSLSRFRMFQDTPLEGPGHALVRIRGKEGGERVQMKLRNHTGEGTCILGGEKYPIGSDFHDLEVPLSEFEKDAGATGAAFRRVHGLDAIVLAVGPDLDLRNQTEVQVAFVRINNRPRRDSLSVLSFLVISFLSTGLGRASWLYFSDQRRTARQAATEVLQVKRFDAFISYASEDKGYVHPLARELTKLRFRVWYDEFELAVGDSLRRSIDKGLANSRFGIVILSPHFFAKEWPQRE